MFLLSAISVHVPAIILGSAFLFGAFSVGGGIPFRRRSFGDLRRLRKRQKQTASEIIEPVDPLALLGACVLLMSFAVATFLGPSAGDFGLLALRLAHMLLAVSYAVYLAYRFAFVRAVIAWDPAKWLAGIALSGFIWTARGDISQAIGEFFLVDAIALPLTLNAGTVVLTLVNGAFAICAVLTSVCVFWAGAAFRLMSGKSLWRGRPLEWLSFKFALEGIIFLCVAFYMAIVNAVGFDENLLRYALKLSATERDALPSSICKNVRPADRVLFLGPPYDNVLVITPPIEGPYLGIDRVKQYPEFTVQGVRKCARGDAGDDAGLATG